MPTTKTVYDNQYDNNGRRIGYVEHTVPDTKSMSMLLCPNCGRKIPDLGARTGEEYGHRQRGRQKYKSVVFPVSIAGVLLGGLAPCFVGHPRWLYLLTGIGAAFASQFVLRVALRRMGHFVPELSTGESMKTVLGSVVVVIVMVVLVAVGLASLR